MWCCCLFPQLLLRLCFYPVSSFPLSFSHTSFFISSNLLSRFYSVMWCQYLFLHLLLRAIFSSSSFLFILLLLPPTISRSLVFSLLSLQPPLVPLYINGFLLLSFTVVAFQEEGTRLLGMIHQGRPLSALPAGDLKIPIIPTLSVSPLFNHFQVSYVWASTLPGAVGRSLWIRTLLFLVFSLPFLQNLSIIIMMSVGFFVFCLCIFFSN